MFTLVPSNFFSPGAERETLESLCVLGENDEVASVQIPQYGAVLVYSYDRRGSASYPPVHSVLTKLPSCKEYNKILCSLSDGKFVYAIAQGKNLLVVNEHSVPDFTTALYFLFRAMKSLQLNPEVSEVTWLNTLEGDNELALYRYFKSVDFLCE